MPKTPQHMAAPHPEPPLSVSVLGVAQSEKQTQNLMVDEDLVFVNAPEASSSDDESSA